MWYAFKPIISVNQKAKNIDEFKSKYPTNASYIDFLYGYILHRTGDADPGRQAWTNALDAGMPRWQAAYLIMSSDEYYLGFIDIKYDEILLRDPDGGGLNNWLVAMRAGMTEEVLPANLYGSAEFYQFTAPVIVAY